MFSSNADRYSDYVRLIREVDLPVIERRPFREVPNTEDPRRAEDFNHYLEVQRSLQEAPPVEDILKRQERPQEGDPSVEFKPRKITIPESRKKLPSNPVEIPNVRDPRKVAACLRAGHDRCHDGPFTLVDGLDNEEECAVLVIDHTEWPRTVSSRIEMFPHECNVLRVQNPDYATTVVDTSLEILEEVVRPSGELRNSIEIVEEEAHRYYSDNLADRPMPGLELENEGLKVDAVIIPNRKRKNSQEHRVPFRRRRCTETIDLDDVKVITGPTSPKVNNATVIPIITPTVHNNAEVIVLIDDDDDDDVIPLMNNNVDTVGTAHTPPVNEPAQDEQTFSNVFSPCSSAEKTGDRIPFLEDADNISDEDPRPLPRPRVIRNYNNNCIHVDRKDVDDEMEDFDFDKYRSYLTNMNLSDEVEGTTDKESQNGDFVDRFRSYLNLDRELQTRSLAQDSPVCSSMPVAEEPHKKQKQLSSMMRINDEESKILKIRREQNNQLTEGNRDNYNGCENSCEYYSPKSVLSESATEYPEPEVSEAVSDNSDDEDYFSKLVQKFTANVYGENKENFVKKSLNSVEKNNSDKKKKKESLSTKECIEHILVTFRKKKQSLSAKECVEQTPLALQGSTLSVDSERPDLQTSHPSPVVISTTPEVIDSLDSQSSGMLLQKASFAINDLKSKNNCIESKDSKSQTSSGVVSLCTYNNSVVSLLSKQAEDFQDQAFITPSASLSNVTNFACLSERLRSNLNPSQKKLTDKRKNPTSCDVTFSTKRPKVKLQGHISLHPQVRALMRRIHPTMQQAAPTNINLPSLHLINFTQELRNCFSIAAAWQFCFNLNQIIPFTKFMMIENNMRRKFITIQGERYYNRQAPEECLTIKEINEPKSCDLEQTCESASLAKTRCVQTCSSKKNSNIPLEIFSQHKLNAVEIKRRHSLPVATVIAPQVKRPRGKSLELSSLDCFNTKNKNLHQTSCDTQVSISDYNFSEERNYNDSSDEQVPQLEMNDEDQRPITSIKEIKMKMHQGLSPSLKKIVKRKILDEGEQEEKLFDKCNFKQRKLEESQQESSKNVNIISNKPPIKILSIKNVDENKYSNLKKNYEKKFSPKISGIFNFNHNCNNDSSGLDTNPKVDKELVCLSLPTPPLEPSEDQKTTNWIPSDTEHSFVDAPSELTRNIKRDSKNSSLNDSNDKLSALVSPTESDEDSNHTDSSSRLVIDEPDQIINTAIGTVSEKNQNDKMQVHNSQGTADINSSLMKSGTVYIDHNSEIKKISPVVQETLLRSKTNNFINAEKSYQDPFSDRHEIRDIFEPLEDNKNMSDTNLLNSGGLEGYQEGDLIYAEYQQAKVNGEDDYEVIYDDGDDDDDDYIIYKLKEEKSVQIPETTEKSKDEPECHCLNKLPPITQNNCVKDSTNNSLQMSKSIANTQKSDCEDDISVVYFAEQKSSKVQLLKKETDCRGEKEKLEKKKTNNLEDKSIKPSKTIENVKEVRKKLTLSKEKNTNIDQENSGPSMNNSRKNVAFSDIEDIIISSCENLNVYISNENETVDVFSVNENANDEINSNSLCLTSRPQDCNKSNKTAELSKVFDNQLKTGQNFSFDVFNDAELLKKYNMVLETSAPDELKIVTPVNDTERKIVDELLTNLMQNSNSLIEPIVSESFDTTKLFDEFCDQGNLKKDYNIFKELNLNFVDIDNIYDFQDKTVEKSSANSLRIRNINELRTLKNSMPPVSASSSISQNHNLSNTTKLNPLQQIQGMVIPVGITQPTTQAIGNFQTQMSLTASSAVLVPMPSIVQSASTDAVNSSTLPKSTDDNLDLKKPVKIFASALFNLPKPTTSTSSSAPQQSSTIINIYQLQLPPVEEICKLNIPLPYKVHKEDSSETLNFKLSNYKRLLLDKMRDSFCKLDINNYKILVDKLFKYNEITQATWNIQLNILRITQCITAIKNLCVHSDITTVIEAILNTPQLLPLSTFVNKSVMERIMNVYSRLEEQGIFSRSASSGCPLFEELERFETEQNQSKRSIIKLKKIQKKLFEEQVKQYSDIIKETNRQLQTLKGQNIRLQKTSSEDQDNKSFINISKEKKFQQSECTLSNNLGSSERNSFNNKCLKCKKPTEIVCNNCLNAAYCSRVCQNNHWIEEHHKKCK